MLSCRPESITVVADVAVVGSSAAAADRNQLGFSCISIALCVAAVDKSARLLSG